MKKNNAKSREPGTLWCKSYSSPLCKDDIHGRFEARDNGEGRIYTFDIGRNRIVARSETRIDASRYARLYAKAYSNKKKKYALHYKYVFIRAEEVDKAWEEMSARYGIGH